MVLAQPGASSAKNAQFLPAMQADVDLCKCFNLESLESMADVSHWERAWEIHLYYWLECSEGDPLPWHGKRGVTLFSWSDLHRCFATKADVARLLIEILALSSEVQALADEIRALDERLQDSE